MKKKEEILEYLREDTDRILELVTECNCWNASLEEYYYWENGEDFFDTYFYNKPFEVARAVNYGSYNYNDEYVRIDAYGNIESISYYELCEELIDNLEEIFDTFYELYKENNVDTYDETLKELLEDYNE